MSSTFLSILPVPSRLACCICPILHLISILFNHSPSFALTVPSAPIIIGIIFTLLQFQIFFSSHFKAWYLSNLTSSTSLIIISNGQDTPIRRHSLFFLSCKVISGLLCSSFLSVCILKSHSILTKYLYYYYYCFFPHHASFFTSLVVCCSARYQVNTLDLRYLERS